jgi:hypothetical protein
MKLTDVIRKVSPAVVAFGSRLYPSKTDVAPGFPPILGTGFIVDERGMVLTNQHVIDAVENIPTPARFVMIFPEPASVNGETNRAVKRPYSLLIRQKNSWVSIGSGNLPRA